ncbi:hypothetical protein K466DRAFT_358578 [Polyporus arcularius HHB13444]|uniref:Uncharacterized protein n=1 Tax=Polyporus arcularius HHB13444 TaxID=1314778 RepID=A0A5C3PNK0_9APHY|nr:hypothetical protein K466DRAFT_358578 [Polyporus arcularius HHB13444]
MSGTLCRFEFPGPPRQSHITYSELPSAIFAIPSRDAPPRLHNPAPPRFLIAPPVRRLPPGPSTVPFVPPFGTRRDLLGFIFPSPVRLPLDFSLSVSSLLYS